MRLEPLYSIEAATAELPKKHAWQVEKNGKNDWRGFVFSGKYWFHILEIADWAKTNKVKLVFVIPPTVSEMQRTIEIAGLTKLSHQFRTELAKLGTVIDLDFDNPVTRDAANFIDAYHFTAEVARMIVAELVGNLLTDKKVLARIEKRRKFFNCDFPKKTEELTKVYDSVVLHEGHNCRNWSQQL